MAVLQTVIVYLLIRVLGVAVVQHILTVIKFKRYALTQAE